MKHILLVLVCLLCVVYARRQSHREFVANKYMNRPDLKNGDKIKVERANKTKGYVYDISECPWMACIVRIGCRRPAYGFNAVFVAASWVLSGDDFVDDETNGGERKKNIVVISQTTDILEGNDGVYHRVKDIVFFDYREFALVKVSDELQNHGFIKIVPPSWEPDSTTLHRLYYWDTYLDDIKYQEDLVLLSDQVTCGGDEEDLCMDVVPFWDDHNMYGAILVNEDDELVALLDNPSDDDNDYEWFDKASFLREWVRATVLSSGAGNYDNAK